MPVNGASTIPELSRVVTQLALYERDLKQVHKERRGTLDTFGFGKTAFASYIFAMKGTARPTNLFWILANAREARDDRSLAALLRAEYDRLLDEHLDNALMTPLSHGGLLVSTPAGRVAVGLRQDWEHPAIRDAAIVIPSSTETFYPTPHLAPLARHAIVRGREVPFFDTIEVDGLRVVRLNDYEVRISTDDRDFGKASLFERYEAGVKAISDPAQYLATWQSYFTSVLESLDELHQGIASAVADQRAPRDENEPFPEELAAPLMHAISAFTLFSLKTRRNFFADTIDHMSWEWMFVNHQNAGLGNVIPTINVPLALQQEGTLLILSDFLDARGSTARSFQPLAYLDKTFCVNDEMHAFLRLQLPKSLPSEPIPLNGIWLTQLINEIVYRAGAASRGSGPATISVRYTDEAFSRLRFQNETPELNPFAHFEEGGPGHSYLRFMAEQMGPAGRIDLHPQMEDGKPTSRIAAIEVAIPQESSPSGNSAGSDEAAAAGGETDAGAASLMGAECFMGCTDAASTLGMASAIMPQVSTRGLFH